jgi:hypothetical protein
VNKKLIMKSAGALMAATTTFGLAAPAAVAQEGDGIATGNDIDVGLNIPIAVCGVAVTLLGGDAQGLCPGTREAQALEGSGSQATSAPLAVANNASTPASGSGDGIASGNGVNVNANVPVAVCGVGVAAAGDATGECPPSGGGPLATASAPAGHAQGSGDGVLAGNGIDVNALIPVVACGIAAALLGADAEAFCG